MSIELISPPPKSTIEKGRGISFTIDDTYTSMLIKVDTDGGTETAYDGTSGGAQSGFTCVVSDDGSQHTFTLKRTAGWALSPVNISVTENETGDSAVTEFGYELSGQRRFARPEKPVGPEDFPKLRISTSGDSEVTIEDVEWIDVVSGTLPDGMDVTNPADEKARLEALASTTDPDAIHANVENEISAITEKGSSNGTDDILIMEDSEAGYIKKKVLARKFANVPLPTKLENDLGCQILFVFDGTLENKGTAGSDWDLVNTGGVQALTASIVKDAKAQWYEDNTKTISALRTSTAATAASGEVTVQAVFVLGKDSRAAGHSRVFGLNRQNSSGAESCWMLRFYDDGTPAGSPLVPAFQYRNAADSATINVKDDTFRLTRGQRYHMVGRRKDDGGGAYDASLWINGLKVAQLDSQVAGYGTDTDAKVKVGAEGGGDGLDRVTMECAKMSNTALTDSQIVGEYKKALGIV